MPTETTPSKATVAAALPEALAALLAAEQAVLDATLRLTHARRVLQRREDTLLMADALLGKNAEMRAAQLRGACFAELQAVEIAEDARLRAASALEGARATFSAWKATARLLAGEDR